MSDELGTGKDDELYAEAVAIVRKYGSASISYLQRRLRIGFSRAAYLIDAMEGDGIITSATNGKAREVIR
jgi:S-DNA-T family DNA segregation ATPase FtsK/SpoIIIE